MLREQPLAWKPFLDCNLGWISLSFVWSPNGHIFLQSRDYFVLFFFFKVKLFNEKRSDLEEQQLHLNVGLQKIRETVDQVNSLSLWRCFSATSALHETLSTILKQLPYFEELFEDLLTVQLVNNSSELVFVLEMCFFRYLTLRYFMSRKVEELQKSLSLKSQELEAKNALANQKLKQMVSKKLNLFSC